GVHARDGAGSPNSRLHVVPPAVVGPGEAHEMRAAGVVTRQPHGLHHGFGAGHMERHFVEPGDGFEGAYVLGDERVVRTEHGAEIPDPRCAGVDTFLVKVVAEDIDAVRTGEVVRCVAV